MIDTEPFFDYDNSYYMIQNIFQCRLVKAESLIYNSTGQRPVEITQTG